MGVISYNELRSDLQEKVDQTELKTNFNNHIDDNTRHLTERLQSFCQNITDWNNANENGFYMGSSAAHAPSTDWHFGIVTCHNPTWCEQRVIAFSSTKTEYVRYQSDGNWSDWKNVTLGDLNALQFGSKVDITTSLNELFQYVNSGKTSVANSIGNPAQPSDTFGTLATLISGGKTNISNAIESKGGSVGANPTFNDLTNAINGITLGKKFASGVINSTSSSSAYYLVTGGTSHKYNLTVSGLDFKPSVIIASNNTNGNYSATFYSNGQDIGTKNKCNCLTASVSEGTFIIDQSPLIIGDRHFTIPVGSSNISYKWLAYE